MTHDLGAGFLRTGNWELRTEMTLPEIETLMEDTRRAARVEDRMQQTIALALLEIARQLTIQNEHFGARHDAPKAKAKAAGKK